MSKRLKRMICFIAAFAVAFIAVKPVSIKAEDETIIPEEASVEQESEEVTEQEETLGAVSSLYVSVEKDGTVTVWRNGSQVQIEANQFWSTTLLDRNGIMTGNPGIIVQGDGEAYSCNWLDLLGRTPDPEEKFNIRVQLREKNGNEGSTLLAEGYTEKKINYTAPLTVTLGQDGSITVKRPDGTEPGVPGQYDSYFIQVVKKSEDMAIGSTPAWKKKPSDCNWITLINDRNTPEAGETYIVNIQHHYNDGNGTIWYTGSGSITYDPNAAEPAPEVKKDYNIIEGGNQILVQGTGRDLVVKADGDKDKCVAIWVDGKKVDATLATGSTIATIKAALLDTMSVGEHKLTFEYTDGYANTKFTLKEAEKTTEATTEATTAATTEASTAAPATVTTTEAAKTTTNTASPKTGDEGIMIYGILMLLSFAGMVGISLKKKDN